MPQTTRTPPKARQPRARGRQAPPQRRFGRPGAPAGRTRRTPSGGPSGFGRLPGRAKPKQKTGIRGALSGLLSKGRGSSPKSGSNTGKTAGGLAAMAAAAGVAFRNRDKLKSMLGRGGDGQSPSSQPPTGAPVGKV
jgi:hypothetical protein